MQSRFFVYVLNIVACVTFVSAQVPEQITLETLYGTVTVTEHLFKELTQNPWMQRLKRVHQYGMNHYAVKAEPEHNRFNHSVGVWLLLKKYNTSLQEQVAGLLHDVSHTAFSHVADFVYKKADLNDAYQDDMHEYFINSTNLAPILARYNFTPESINPKNKNFKALAPDVPELSADRLEYNLSDGYFAELITQNEIQALLDKLMFDGELWYFTDKIQARKLAGISLYLTEHEWGAPRSCVINFWAAQLVQRALACALITHDQFQYDIDENLWVLFTNAHDKKIQDIIHKMRNYNQYFTFDKQNYDVLLKSKFRGINPWVKVQDKLVRLTELDADFAAEYARVQKLMEQGWCVKFLT